MSFDQLFVDLWTDFIDSLCSSSKSNNTVTSQPSPQDKETSTTIKQEICPKCRNGHMVIHHTCCEICIDLFCCFFDSSYEELCCCARKKKKCRTCGHIIKTESDCC